MKAYLFFVIVFMICLTSDGFAADKHISLSTCEYPPYYGEQLENNGFIAEIITEAYKRMNYSVDITFYPWPRAYEYGKRGEIVDGLFTFGVVTEERLQLFEYSDPLPPLVFGFYKLVEDDIFFTTLEDLISYRIGVVRGYIYDDSFEDIRANLEIDEVSVDKQNVLKLEAGRLDLILIERFNANYLIRTKFPELADVIEWLEPPISVDAQYLAISKRAPDYLQKVDDFNRGLELIKQDGTFEEILSKHGYLELKDN